MEDFEERKTIINTTKELGSKYPIEANYNSRQSLWAHGLKDGSVSQKLYNEARIYYGTLWTYVGD